MKIPTSIFINESSVRMPRSFINRWLRGIFFYLQEHKIKDLNILNRNSLNRSKFPNINSCVINTIKKNQVKNKEQTLTLVFLNLKPAKELNLRYRNKNYATDILSFDGNELNSFGELVLCPQVLQKQAEEHGLSFRLELGYMLIHGILHLMGYDHEKSKAKARVMFKIQDNMFDKLCCEEKKRNINSG